VSRKKPQVPVAPPVEMADVTVQVRVTEEGFIDDPQLLREIAAEAMEGLSLMIAVAVGKAQMTRGDLAQYAEFVKVNYPLIAKVQWEGQANETASLQA